MRHFILIGILLGLSACNKSSADASGNSAASASAPNAAPAADGLADVALDPLPLKIKVRPGGQGAMDMSRDDRKSVTVDIGDGASLNVSAADKSLAELKKSYEGDTILFPFKKWVKEESDLAILLFENDGKQGYIGFKRLEIGGKAYVCKTTGMNGVKTAELATSQLANCANVQAK